MAGLSRRPTAVSCRGARSVRCCPSWPGTPLRPTRSPPVDGAASNKWVVECERRAEMGSGIMFQTHQKWRVRAFRH